MQRSDGQLGNLLDRILMEALALETELQDVEQVMRRQNRQQLPARPNLPAKRRGGGWGRNRADKHRSWAARTNLDWLNAGLVDGDR